LLRVRNICRDHGAVLANTATWRLVTVVAPGQCNPIYTAAYNAHSAMVRVVISCTTCRKVVVATCNHRPRLWGEEV
jgi:hypothetical protein